MGWGHSSFLAELALSFDGWERRKSHLGTGGHINRVTCGSQLTLGDAGRGMA